MANVARIKEEIQKEFNHPSKSLSHVEFNRRGGEVVMTYVYFPDTHDNKDPHLAAHNKDPEWLNIEEMNQLEKFLRDNNLSFNERTDVFI
ncbi:hypothetical protein [Macrococcus equipercicus]|uniref:Uncharacterized protein n=1 Tax=Macrococcus equipercicus TaxID=69967 RepID=A0A9Q9BXP3_9STAP|nr:hypothetical protein [Macrococcus equipercicus]KAA1042661.1 hypothetical protein ERX35_001920 [Macrococcus equipercicus]UTH14527.1 hypothetical protein KFV11_03975 [Macrococcus equipercicus]